MFEKQPLSQFKGPSQYILRISFMDGPLVRRSEDTDQRSERVGEWERNFALPPSYTNFITEWTNMQGRAIMSIK